MATRPVQIPSQVIENNRTRGRFGSLQYPSRGATHGVYMEFYNYSYGGGNITGVNRAGSIALPLPQNISDNVSVNVNPGQLGIIGAGVADIATGQGSNFLSELKSGAIAAGKTSAEAISGLLTSGGANASALTNFLSNAGTYANYMAKAGLTSLDSGIGQALSVSSGEAINPHATLVFEGVALKNFGFQWSLSPSNEQESREIHNIIRTVQSKILPRYKSVAGSSGSSFSRGILTYPNMIDIYFVGFDPSKIFRFKRSMINTFTVDYSPQGNVMIKGAAGSAPAFVNIAMNFTEAEIWTADDYSSGNGEAPSAIGVGPR